MTVPREKKRDAREKDHVSQGGLIPSLHSLSRDR
jgi:hypothetical protein